MMQGHGLPQAFTDGGGLGAGVKAPAITRMHRSPDPGDGLGQSPALQQHAGGLPKMVWMDTPAQVVGRDVSTVSV
jgi:hypothetical protein